MQPNQVTTESRWPTRAAGAGEHRYDIHGIVRINSAVELPELEYFRVNQSIEADVTVAVGGTKPVSDGNGVAYSEWFGRLGFAATVNFVGDRTEVRVSRMVGSSRHVLYTNVVEPVIRWHVVCKGFALVHAACVEKHGLAFLITARSDTGKTTTMLKMLCNDDGFSFISDDLTLVDAHGYAYSYPKPLTISRHTVHATPRNRLTRRQRLGLILQSRLHSRTGRRFGFVAARAGAPAATMNALVQRLIPPPKYHVATLIPEAVLTPKARVANLFVIERGGSGSYALSDEESLAILLENCEDAYGFPPYRSISPFLKSQSGLNLAEVERAIIAEALEGVPGSLHESETMDWADLLPPAVEVAVERSLNEPEILIGLADFEDSIESESRSNRR